ncbi:Cytochrome c-type biogenesis protein CcmH precursor [Hartmannibacter diazotrophicus]|uniref:Cytochrome c-type biogenesis protein CcmH n=1 Tax=Hartmannibacter diazotrophicus TaxID=1482074 RepID=A0A2C9D422_9HYPH|nr:c-type cytochrome biogenesis protein CcmI [Hartmannibacter diazotrophicus]SON54983.1 Cytochrome c-type biogenesis protein CcmH precursor [Hartmannibacter diazotrophicus]
MTIWILFALMTGIATVVLLVPMARVARRGTVRDIGPEEVHDLAVYKDQMAEIDRDRERGVLGEAEASAARNEIARRLLRAGDRAESARDSGAGRSHARLAAVAVIAIVPFVALAAYIGVGSPDMPDQPLASRACGPDIGIENVVICVERHLARNPADAEGWRVLAPVYMRLGRAQDAANAYRQVMDLSGETSELLTDYAGALMMASQGVVSRPAVEALQKAMAVDQDNMRARFYYAGSLASEGKKDEALKVYDDILARSPKDAPWLDAVRQAQAMIKGEVPPAMAEAGPGAGGMPGPNAADVAAASSMSTQDRQAMIAGMVARLAGRLEENPDDIEGWLRLIRAYGVLGDADKRTAAIEKAKVAFEGKDDALRRIEEAAGATN